MELRQLECFVEVAHRGTVTGAAAGLRLSQPALTRQMHRLEREIGVPLFRRTPTGMALTPAGTALLPHARSVLDMVRAAADVARAAGPVPETVSVGLAPGIPAAWLSAVLDRVADRVPHARLACADDGSAAHLRELRAGRLDLAVVHTEPPPLLRWRLVHRQPCGVATHPDLASRPCGTWPMRLLDGRPVLAPARGLVPAVEDTLTVRAHERGIAPEWRFARIQENAAAHARASGTDLAVLTEDATTRWLPGWSWHRLVEPEIAFETFVARQHTTRLVVEEVFDAVASGDV